MAKTTNKTEIHEPATASRLKVSARNNKVIKRIQEQADRTKHRCSTKCIIYRKNVYVYSRVQKNSTNKQYEYLFIYLFKQINYTKQICLHFNEFNMFHKYFVRPENFFLLLSHFNTFLRLYTLMQTRKLNNNKKKNS